MSIMIQESVVLRRSCGHLETIETGPMPDWWANFVTAILYRRLCSLCVGSAGSSRLVKW